MTVFSDLYKVYKDNAKKLLRMELNHKRCEWGTEIINLVVNTAINNAFHDVMSLSEMTKSEVMAFILGNGD